MTGTNEELADDPPHIYLESLSCRKEPKETVRTAQVGGRRYRVEVMKTAGAGILIGAVHDQEPSEDVSGFSSAQGSMAMVEQLSRVETGEQHLIFCQEMMTSRAR